MKLFIKKLFIKKRDCFITVFFAMIYLIDQTTAIFAGIGKTGAVFLQEDIGARPLGMGCAFTAIADDITGMNFNPAGLDYIVYPELTIMYKKNFLDTYSGYVGYLKPFRHNGTLGIGVTIFDGGDIELNYLDGRTEKVKMEQDIVLSLGYGRSFSFIPFLSNLGEMLFFGASVKLINSTLGDKYTANAVASDFGLLFRTIDSRLSIGAAVQNYGTELKYKEISEPLPMSIRYGFALVLKQWEENTWLSTLDYIQTINEPAKIHLGTELWLFKNFAVRAGYKIGYKPDVFTLGLGILAYKIQFDYGYVSSEIDMTHRISITSKFGSREKRDIAKRYEEKGMYDRAEYTRSPEDYKYAKAKTDRGKNQLRPIITSIEPKRATPGSVVTIYGVKFDDSPYNLEVKFGEYYADIIEANFRKIKVKVPVNIPAGDTNVYVITKRGRSEPEIFSVIPLKPPRVNVSNIKFIDENDNGTLEAEESGKIVFNISNLKGAGDAFDIKANIQISGASFDIKYKPLVRIGDIKPGESKIVEIPLSAGLDLRTGKVNFNITFTEANGFNPEPIEIKGIPTHKLEPPDIQLAKIEIDDNIYPDRPEKLSVGNNNGMIEPGESVEVVATIVNKGTGPTKDTIVKIICDNPDINFLPDNTDRIRNLGEIQPGEWEEIKFAIMVKKKYSGSNVLPLKLHIIDSRERFNKEIPLNLTIGRVYPRVQVVEVKGKPVEITVPKLPTFGEELSKLPEYITPVRNNAYAVVIGIEKYRDIKDAEYAVRDAQLVRDYLVKAMGFKEENIMYAINERASKSDLIKYFEVWLKNRVDKNSIVLIYYSGHGAPNPTTGESFIVPYDGDPNVVDDTCYSLKRLYESLNNLPTDTILVVMDACFSGAGGPRTVLAKGMRPIVVTMKDKELTTGKIVVLTAASGSQISGTYEEKQLGLFTYFFLRGLQGDADKNKDRKVMLGELYEYLKPEVIKRARYNNREQEPQILPSPYQLGEWGKIPLVILK